MRAARRLALCLPLLVGCAAVDAADDDLEARARALHADALVLDTHADTTMRFADADWNFGARHAASDGHVDLPRLREGGVDAQFWSIYLGKRDAPGLAVREALERIDSVHQLVARFPELGLATSEAEVRAHVRAGRIASLMGVEGGHIIENSLAVLRTYQRLGARYLTLTHSFHTDWADSSGTTQVPEPRHGGLTAFGEQVVAELNRLGMMVDVSHVSDATFWHVLRVTRAPVIASHSSCRAVADHPRNLDDAMLRGLAENGGVVMLNFYPAYLDAEAGRATAAYFAEHGPALRALGDDREARRAYLALHPVPQTSLDVLLDHFDHALRVAGPDHVGLGSDWDGVPAMPLGLEQVSELPNLTLGLLRRGHSEATVRKVLGENLLRVMRQVEGVAAALQLEDGGADDVAALEGR